jgi:hypothetical protein
MLRRLTSLLRRPPVNDEPATPAAPRDYAQEREDRRTSQLSDEDKAWGAASQQRELENREQDQKSTAS